MVDNMTGYQSKKAMAQAKLEDDDDIQTYTRPWVGLTLNEIALIHANYPNPQGFALALQDKLKEKNT